MNRIAPFLAAASLLSACRGGGATANDGHSHVHEHVGGASSIGPLNPAPHVEYDYGVPADFAVPWEPVDNPTTREKVELGRALFYDERLSRNGTQSCASCHRQELAFTDGLARGVGSTGEQHPRGSMSLANVGYAASLTWSNPLVVTLEDQALLPLFGDQPVELGNTAPAQVEERLQADGALQVRFREAFPNDEELPGHYSQVVRALAAFERTLISANSPFDRWQRTGSDPEFGEAEQRGYVLFNAEKFECFHCHAGFAFSDHVHYTGKPFYEAPFHNTGLYNLDAEGSYPEPNTGVHSVTGEATDMGRFKAPTLRNIAVTAPYMHDGSVATLEEVLDHYAAGGRTITSGPHAGVGSDNPNRDPLIRAFEPTERERADLIAFLRALTDEEFLKNPSFSDPEL